MKMIFKELFLFSPYEKKAKYISFNEGINVITSNQKNGTDRGKSVIMRSLYHTLGAESDFEAKWDTKSKVYILHFFINEIGYYMYRSADLYKLFDNSLRLLFVTTHSHDLSERLKEYTDFAVMLPSRSGEKLEITPPVYNYLPFFIDQDHYNGSKYTSFKNLQQYDNFKDYVISYHLGIYDDSYFELIKEKESLTESYDNHKLRLDMLNSMQSNIDKKIESRAYSTNIDQLQKDVQLHQKEYTNILSQLNKCKSKLIELRNNLYDYDNLLHEMSLLTKDNEKQIDKLNNHLCPECGSVLSETISLRSKRYNLSEDIIAIKNELQLSITNVTYDIEMEEKKYKKLLDQLSLYEDKLKMNTKEVDDILRYKGFCEIREDVITEKHETIQIIEDEDKHIKDINLILRKYGEKKKKIEEKYYVLLSAAQTKFGLNEINTDKFKKLHSTFNASGSNRNIATVIWYLAINQLRYEFNPYAIQFPIVFDSPNNVETDDIKKQSLLQYIFDNAKNSQLIISSIGFDKTEFSSVENINVIKLENEKYSLLDEKTYIQYEHLLNALCDTQ